MTPPAATLPTDDSPRLCVLIDVEEEFDWESGFDAGRRGVSHLRRLPELLDRLAPRGLAPVGVCSYPVVEDEAALDVLRAEVGAGRMLLGSHLHPWVCPPEYEVSDHNSFPGNLPAEVELAKLQTLTEALQEAFGERPRVYQAGRYGLGPTTYRALEQLEYLVDMSVSPPFDYTDDGGPDYRHTSSAPWWVGEHAQILSLPVTGGFVGRLARFGPSLHALVSSPAMAPLRLQAVLSRARLLERLRLSPEGHRMRDLVRLTRHLLERGERVFTLSFHSPSLDPGHTSYVGSEADRSAFLDRISRYLDFFVEQLGGTLTTPLELHAQLSDARTRSDVPAS